MRTALPNAARDTVAPTLHKAQDTLTETVLPAVRDALVVVRERGSDLLDSDVTTEARRRGLAVVKAAKGDVVYVPASTRRWRFGLGMLAAGTAIGVTATWLAKKLAAPVDSYTQTMPVPSGTDGGIATGTTDSTLTGGIDGVTTGAGGTTTTGAAPAGTAVDDIDLRSGAPTNV